MKRWPKLTHAQVRSIAARLLDDMCANIMTSRIKTFDEHDVNEVAISLGEMLADEGVADEYLLSDLLVETSKKRKKRIKR